MEIVSVLNEQSDLFRVTYSFQQGIQKSCENSRNIEINIESQKFFIQIDSVLNEDDSAIAINHLFDIEQKLNDYFKNILNEIIYFPIAELEKEIQEVTQGSFEVTEVKFGTNLKEKPSKLLRIDFVKKLKKSVLDYMVFCNNLNEIEKLVFELEESIQESLTNKEAIRLISELNQSVEHLANVHMNTSTSNRMNQKRVFTAKYMLAEGKNGQEIYKELNYSSVFNFYKTFSKYSNMTTKEFYKNYLTIMARLDSLV